MVRVSLIHEVKKGLRMIYWGLGVACIAYYFLIGMAARFGLSLSWLWLALGGMFLVVGILCTGEVPKWLRILWRTGLSLGLAAMLALLGVVSTGMHQTPPEDLDYLIVLGARVEENGPSRALQRRITAALQYLEDNPDTVIIASGGQGADEPISEARCIRDELVENGVSETQIIMEDRSTSTVENLQFSAELIEDLEASVGIVTNNYHVYRATWLAKHLGYSEVYGVAAKYESVTLLHFMVRDAICLVVEWIR